MPVTATVMRWIDFFVFNNIFKSPVCVMVLSWNWLWKTWRCLVNLHTYNMAWQLHPGCPCDVEFNQYISRKSISGKSIFHFGTGAHHVVGMAAAGRNDVLGVTASVDEYKAFMDIIVKNPSISINYKCMFCDIYTLSENSIPCFDIVTLFHSGEYYSPELNSYAPLDDRSLIEFFIGKLKPDGIIVFYKKSNGFIKISLHLEDLIGVGFMEKYEEVGNLLIYRKVIK